MKKRKLTFPDDPDFEKFLDKMNLTSSSEVANSDKVTLAHSSNHSDSSEQELYKDTQSSLVMNDSSNSQMPASILSVPTIVPLTQPDVTVVQDEIKSEPSSVQPAVSSQNTETSKVMLTSKDNEIGQPNVGLDSKANQVTDLRNFLIGLPHVELSFKGFSKEETQVRITQDLSEALRFLPKYMSSIDDKSLFRVDDLVNYLLRQFIRSNLVALDEMGKQMIKNETLRQQKLMQKMKDI